MKKLLLILFLLFTVNSYSQTLIQAFAAQIGHWNKKTSKYNWQTIEETNITFRIQSGFIFVTDKNNSVYELITLESKSDTQGIWSALDELKEECTIMINYPEDDDNILVVIYDTFCIKYYFE